jgi:hypothetical protein
MITGPGRPERATWNASFLENARDILGARDQVVMLGQRPARLDDRRFLKGVGAEDGGADLAGDSDDRAGVHLGVGEAGDEVGGSRAAGGEADADLAGAARIALGCETAALLVPWQDGAQTVADASESLVNRHAGAARIGEYDVYAMVEQTLHQNSGPGHWRL